MQKERGERGTCFQSQDLCSRCGKRLPYRHALTSVSCIEGAGSSLAPRLCRRQTMPLSERGFAGVYGTLTILKGSQRCTSEYR